MFKKFRIWWLEARSVFLLNKMQTAELNALCCDNLSDLVCYKARYERAEIMYLRLIEELNKLKTSTK